MKYFLLLLMVLMIPLIGLTIYKQFSGVEKEVEGLLTLLPTDELQPSDAVSNFQEELAPPIQTYQTLSEKNIFHPERKDVKADESEQEEENPEEEKPPVQPPSDIKVMGIIIIGENTRLAYLSNQKDQKAGMKQYSAGDTIGDYEVIEILADRVKLKAGEETSIIKLASSSSAKMAGNPKRRNRDAARQAAARNRANRQTGGVNRGDVGTAQPGMTDQFDEQQNADFEAQEAARKRALARERMRNMQQQQQQQEEYPSEFQNPSEEMPFNQPPDFFNPAFENVDPESFSEPLPWEENVSGSAFDGGGFSGRRTR